MRHTPSTPARQRTSEAVEEAVKALDRIGRSANRHSVHDWTGLKMTIVDDRLKVLTDDGTLIRKFDGHYQPAPPRWPRRAIKTCAHPDGRWSVDIDGAVLQFCQDDFWLLTRRACSDGTITYTLDEQTLTVTPEEDAQVGILHSAIQARERQGHWSGFAPSKVG